ncbi:hypothetical protein SDC9_156259 [bioreactor metagenome]|uniref:Uncharacterized protein n=1 Tax=bioreactor metagenome TaxID=1076179 RepID=A0A645F3Y0_9ZZZZ
MRHILALAAGSCALAARNLYAMRSIHDYRITKITHNRQSAHIRNQVVVAEAGAAFRQHDIIVACFFCFGNDIFHIPWCQKLAFFNIDYFAGFCCLIDQICLTAKKRRYLQNIQNFSCFFYLAAFMDIADCRHAEIFFDLSDNFQTFFQTRSAERFIR